LNDRVAGKRQPIGPETLGENFLQRLNGRREGAISEEELHRIESIHPKSKIKEPLEIMISQSPFLVFMLEFLLKSSCLLLGVLAARSALHRSSAANRAALLLAGMIAALLLPATKLATPLWHYQWKPPEQIAKLATKGLVHQPTLAAPAETNEMTTAPKSRPSGWNLRIDVPTALIWLWLSGSLLILARRIGAALRLRTLVKQSVPATQAAIANPGASTLLGASLDIRVSRQTKVPLATGIIRPRILLPETALTWTASRQRAALLHEAAHVARRDCLARWIADLALAFYWMNPLAWIARRAMIVEQEQACDDFVLIRETDSADYASQLLEIVRGLGQTPPPSALAMAHPSTLETRIRAIVDETRDRRSLSGLQAARGLGLMVFSLIACSALQLSAASKRIQEKKPAAPMAAPQQAMWEVSGIFVEIEDGTKLPEIPMVTQSLETAMPRIELLDEVRYQEVMRALNKTTKGVSFLGGPRVTSYSKQTNRIELVQDYTYPTNWKKVGPSNAWKPVKFEKKQLGITLESSGVIQPDGSLDLTKLMVKAVKLVGFSLAQGDVAAPASKPVPNLSDFVGGKVEGLDQIRPWSSPIISTTMTTTGVSPIYSGQTIFLPLAKSSENAHSRFLAFITVKVLPAHSL
jgi:beta-lactamase regulating signal transducer with metallopeptidase domain